MIVGRSGLSRQLPTKWLLYVFAFVLGWVLSGLNPGRDELLGYNWHRLALLFLLVLSALSVLASEEVRLRVAAQLAHLPRVARAGIWIAISFGLLSAAKSQFPWLAFQEILLFVSLLGAALVLSTTPGAADARLMVFPALAAMLVFAVQYPFDLAIVLLHSDQNALSESIRGFANRRFLNDAQAFIIPLVALLPLLMQASWLKYVRIALWVGAVFFVCLVFVSAGRGILLALIGGGLTAALAGGTDGRRFALSYTKLLVAGLAAFLLFLQLPFTLIRGQVDRANTLSRFADGGSGREYLWAQALEMIKANPLLGIGPQHYGPTLQTFAHPHNSMLQWTSEWGMIAGGILVGLLAWMIIASWRRVRRLCPHSDRKQALVASAYAASITAAAIYSLFAGTLAMPIGQLCLVMVLAALLWQQGQSSGPRRPVSLLERRVIVALLPLSALVLFSFSIAQLALSQDRGMPCGGQLNFPRFWIHSSSNWPYEQGDGLESLRCPDDDSAPAASEPPLAQGTDAYGR
jgi:putative inorganic carbon (hco3(-)) transporter